MSESEVLNTELDCTESELKVESRLTVYGCAVSITIDSYVNGEPHAAWATMSANDARKLSMMLVRAAAKADLGMFDAGVP